MPEKDFAIRDLLRAGKKIEALRLYRERYGGGLKEAKDAIDELESDAGVTGYVTLSEQNVQLTDRIFREEVEARLRAGRTIAAIKLYREKYPEPLQHAKRTILAWKSALGPECLTEAKEDALDEMAETFDIRWKCTIHPEKRFLFWKEAEAFLEVRFELQVSESTIADDFAVSLWDLAASRTNDGEYAIFTCRCGDMGCGGFTAIEIVHLEGRVLWYDANDWTHWHLFDTEQYEGAIRRFAAALVELPQRHQGLSIKFFCNVNTVNSLSGEPAD